MTPDTQLPDFVAREGPNKPRPIRLGEILPGNMAEIRLKMGENAESGRLIGSKGRPGVSDMSPSAQRRMELLG